MIAYRTSGQAALRAQLLRDELPSPRLTKAQFIDRECGETIPTTARPDGKGVTRWGMDYVALPCRVQDPHNPGWVLVRDDPGAINHYQSLFGRVIDARPAGGA